MMLLSDAKRYITHRILRYQDKSFRVDELRDKLKELKKEEKKVLSHLGYSVYGRGDAAKYGRPGKDFLEIEEDMAIVEELLYAKERKLKY